MNCLKLKDSNLRISPDWLSWVNFGAFIILYKIKHIYKRWAYAEAQNYGVNGSGSPSSVALVLITSKIIFTSLTENKYKSFILIKSFQTTSSSPFRWCEMSIFGTWGNFSADSWRYSAILFRSFDVAWIGWSRHYVWSNRRH